MVQRIFNLSKWTELPPGSVLNLPGDHNRKIRVEVNCEVATSWRVAIDGANPVLLCATPAGRDVIEFTAEGNVLMTPSSEGDVWVYTAENGFDATETTVDSFTSVMNRKERNPQLELMLWKQESRMRQREAALAEEREIFMQRLAEMAEQMGADRETGEIDGDGDAATAGGAASAAGAASGAAKEPAAGAVDGGTK